MRSQYSISTSIFTFNLSLALRILLLFLFISQSAVAQKTKKKSVGPAEGTIELSPLQLRETMNDFFYRFERSITESADSIIRASSDSRIDQEALIWKMNAIPVANGSIYNNDPFLGYIDVAVFTYQMKLFFEEGKGKDLFGEHQKIAIQTLDMLWEEILNIGRDLVPDKDISEGRKLVIEFAEKNPITSSYFVRKSTIPLMTQIQMVEKVTFKGLAVDMSQSLDGLRSQVSSYMEVLPKQVRWEAEYLLNNTLNNPELSSRIDSLTQLLERSVLFIESSPELIDDQREAAFEDIRAERIAVLQAIRQERAIVLEELKSERAIIIGELSEELTKQQEAIIQDLTVLTNQSLEITFDRMESLVDKLYWRTVVLISVLLVVVFIGLIVYKKI